MPQSAGIGAALPCRPAESIIDAAVLHSSHPHKLRLPNKRRAPAQQHVDLHGNDGDGMPTPRATLPAQFATGGRFTPPLSPGA